MTQRQTLFPTPLRRGFSFGLQPAPAWTAILGLVLFSALCILAGAGSILRLVYPLASFAIAVFLYLRYPVLYVGFTWWMWLITAFVRRLVDYRSGWDAQGVMLIAPYLVTFVSLATFLRYLPKLNRQGTLPFIMAAMAVCYGFLMGIVKFPPFSVVRALLDWLGPILFAFHLFVNWRDYPSYRQNIQRTFLWGVLVTGAYGVFQYVVAPEWDRLWLINAKLTSMGNPVPFGIRVWSTLNSVAPFASVMMTGLLLLFSTKGILRFPAAAVGFLSFFLTQSRSGWLGWVLGIFLTISSVKPRLQMRLITTVMIVVLCVVPLTTIDPFSKVISTRLQTFSNLEKDNSAQVRQEIYKENLDLALSSGLGSGLGNVWVVKENGQLEVLVIDSGIIEILITLGWFGTIPYVGGIFLICLRLLQSSESSSDIFASTSRAIGVSCFLQLIGGSAQLGLSGLIMWGFLGMSMAANKYHNHQHLAQLQEGSAT